jgi:DNA polymerase-3 subunit delta
MSIDNDALQLLCDRIEGNLLAAVQEVEKLKLLAEGGQITAETVTTSVSNNARYNLFDMTDNALKGNAAGSLKMLHGLRGEGTEPAVALWALLREIRTLYQAQQSVDSGQNPQQALSSLRVWKNRIGLMQGALGRHSRDSLSHLMEQATEVDGSIKGFSGGKPWDNLESLILDLASVR